MSAPHLEHSVQLPSELTARVEKHWQALGERLHALHSRPARSSDDFTRLLAGSEFAAECLKLRMGLLEDLVESGDLYRRYEAGEYAQRLNERLLKVSEEPALHSQLRQFRQREMVRLIFRDLNRLNDMQATTAELSDLADACIDQTLSWLYERACTRWGVPYSRPDAAGHKHPQQLVVLGMGKLGAHELNLSSDIDLIFCFPENGETEGARKSLENQDFFIRLGQKLIQALDNTTVEGFVFRTDMRLRPFGSAGPLAISFDAMENYYQTQGREWERYAMIKARVVAGDQAAGAELMALLKPFVYRKYIDFSAFESLRDMKGMINREVRRKGLQQNVKLGAGGIREVEFIAQAFQLIRGGRDSRLQQRELLRILPLLPEAVGMPEQVVTDLMQAYFFLRNTEHAIQAVYDRQTQELPVDVAEQARLAFVMGFSDWESFYAALESERDKVRKEFADVIAPAQTEEEEQEQGSQEWQMFWDEQLDNEQVDTWLAETGFCNPADARKQLTDLREARVMKALQQVALNRLHAVMPLLISETGAVDNANIVLTRVLKLVQAVLRRSAYLVLLAENPGARQQLVRLCSASGWFGEQLARQPILLDELIDTQSLYSPPNKQQLQNELRQQLIRIPQEDTEQQMEALRYFKNAHTLRVAASEITGALPLMKVSDYLTWLAEVILESVLEVAWQDLTEKYGLPTDAEGQPCERDFVVIGYGKVGGIELSYGSDLDLVFMHDNDPNRNTNGERSIANGVFFTRLGQRIIHMLNTFTPSGQLYEVDMRLRPSGNSGLLVSSLKAFEEYQLKEAWTWEKQALVRARVLAGSPRLANKFTQVRANVLGQPRELAELAGEVAKMRDKMREHLGSAKNAAPGEAVFHIKHDQGGIVDIEFMVQYSVLAQAHRYPELLTFTDNIRILDTLEQAGLLNAADADALREAYKAYRAAGHRLTLQEQSGVIAGDEMCDYRAAVSRIWQQIIGAQCQQA